MSTEPLDQVLVAFTHVIARRCRERNVTVEEFAAQCGFRMLPIENVGKHRRVTDLRDFFRIAWALGEEPVILFTDLVAEWRKDPTDLGLYKSRASDLAKLYRLGYHHDPGDFRELPRIYSHIDEAMAVARTLNATRRSKRLPLLDTALTYVRVGNVAVRPDAEVRP